MSPSIYPTFVFLEICVFPSGPVCELKELLENVEITPGEADPVINQKSYLLFIYFQGASFKKFSVSNCYYFTKY